MSMVTGEATGATRLAALDSLRGLAILAVLFGHLLQTSWTGPALGSAMADLGRGGVTLFFILSGYLIFRNVQKQPVGTFFRRRFFKVMPAYWLNIGVILLADLCLERGGHFPARSYFASLFVVSDVLGIDAVSGVFWTLLIEIKFYIFIAIQYLLLRRRHLHLVLVSLIALEVVLWGVRGRGSLTLAYFPVFYLGIEISLTEAAGWHRLAVARLMAVALLLAGSLYLCLDQQKLGSAAYLLVSAALFTVFLRRGWSHRIAGFFGASSYSNYLYHSLVTVAVASLFGKNPTPAATVGIVCLAFVAATLAGVLLYRLVEVPMVNLGHRLTARADRENNPCRCGQGAPAPNVGGVPAPSAR